MEVSLPPDLQQFLTDQVSRGIFPTVNDAVKGAVEALRERDADRDRRRLELFRELDLSIEEEERGEGAEVPLEKLDEFFEQIKKEAREELRQERANRS